MKHPLNLLDISLLSRCLLVAMLLLNNKVEALASRSKAKKLSTAAGKGFGASKGPSLSHIPDKSESTLKLIEYLKSQKAKGVEAGVAEIGIPTEGGTSTGRGLFATTNIKKGQIICMIPSDVALALSDPKLMGDDAPTFAHCGVNLLKMYMKDPKMKEQFAFYLDTLPANTESPYFDATPDYFSDKVVELLEFPRLVNNVKKRKTDVESLAAEHGIDKEELQFATWLVSSRAFNINLLEEANKEEGEEEKYDERGQVIAKAGAGLKSIKVMIPYLDMVNHDSSSPNCRFTMIDPAKDEAWFALEANRPIPAGNEIKIAYRSGIYSSAELLLNYGFVPEENKVDSFMLRKGGDDSIPNLEGWTTTLDEDETMLKMMDEEPELKKIISFRANLKKAYKDV